MNKLLLGVGLTLGLAVRPGGEAAAQTREQCAPVYDETRADVSPELASIMGQYAVHGIEVHVQIFDDARSEDVYSPNDAEAYAERLARVCGWSTHNRLNVFVAREPRAYDVAKTGTTINESEVDSVADGSFRDSLRDTSTDNQDDVHNLLVRINPYDNQPTFPARAPVLETGPTENGPDIPFQTIGLGLGVAAIIAGAGARTKRHFTLRGDTEPARTDSTVALKKLAKTTEAAENQLQTLPPDDAIDLRASHTAAANILAQVTTSRDQLTKVYRSQRRKVWPNRDSVIDMATALSKNVQLGHESADMLGTETTQVTDFIERIDSLVTKFTGLVTQAHTAAENIQATGWDIGHYAEELAGFDSDKATIANLREQHYVEKPAGMIEGRDDEVITLTDQLTALPAERETADLKHNQQPGIITARTGAIAEASQALTQLRTEYHPSCYQDLSAADTRLGEQVRKLQVLHDEAQAHVGVKSVTSLEATQTAGEQFDATVVTIDGLAGDIYKRVADLEDIKTTLPESLEAVTDSLDEARVFAFDQHTTDVEDDTRAKIQELEQAFADLRDEVTADQPRYLELRQQVGSHYLTAQSLMGQARREKSEMDTLRTEIDRMSRTARTNLSTLNSYIGSHMGDVGHLSMSAHGATLPDADTTQGRQALRNQTAEFKDFLTTIRSLQSDAESKVQAEEARRRREEERQRQASLAAMQTTTSYDPPTTHSSGGY